jgi:hypothetical protein
MKNMHRSSPIGNFIDEEIYKFSPGPRGYSDNNDCNDFRGKSAGNRIAFQLNLSNLPIPFGQAPEFALRPPIESGLG